ncbi:MAG TPA: hypothetical protein DCM08_00025, partial [Microscillaceae bacterium]|nr:hypothetical protein [Microscillaceae bacterium]
MRSLTTPLSPIFRIWIFCLFFAFAGMPWAVQAQILDDTTKQIPLDKSVRFFLEKDILDDQKKSYQIDTTIENLHRYEPVRELHNKYVDLGGIGTPMRPLYYQQPQRIGTTLGVQSFQPYLFNTDNVRYFDALVPYSHAYYIQGSRGDQFIDFTFTRSNKERFNVGFQYRRMLSEKQFAVNINRTAGTPDLYADQHRFVFHLSWTSKNKRYQLLAHFAHLNTMVFDNGGVRLLPGQPRNDIFAYSFATPQIAARTWQTQNNLHLYHQYELAKGFKLFHILDRFVQRDDFNHQLTGGDTLQLQFLNVFRSPGAYFDPNTTAEGFRYQMVENKVGIKGLAAGKFYYQAYIKNRIFRYWNPIYEGKLAAAGRADSFVVRAEIQEIENFIGGKLYYQFGDSARLQVEAEYLVGRADYRIAADLTLKQWINLGVRSTSFAPTLMQRRMMSNWAFWDRTLLNTFAQEFYVRTTLPIGKKLLIEPYASYQLINNYIYFDTTARPVQTAEGLQIVQAGLKWRTRFGRFHWVNEWIYTQNLGANLIRFPEVFVNTQVYCENCFLRKYLNSQIGLDIHYKSGYLADAYMPITKQFHLQNSFF